MSSRPNNSPERHAKQAKRLAEVQLQSKTLKIPLNQPYKILRPPRPRTQTTGSSPAGITKPVYCFNLLVALEWQPSPEDQRVLVEAFRRASAFLYDVTDGAMAFGQIVVGGMELMDCADIQIMASNRLNPRSWVNALTEEAKYMPIRAGRGIWHKNRRISIPWIEPEGYRTLIHEWAHYALGLRDEYLKTTKVPLASSPDRSAAQTNYTLVVPTISLATESIMGSLEGTSELVPQTRGKSSDRKQRVWTEITQRYPEAQPDSVPNAGPYALPAELNDIPTLFQNKRASSNTGSALSLFTNSQQLSSSRSGLLLTVPSCIVDEHCWIYVVKPDLDDPTQVIAQGTLDARALTDDFELLNATTGDRIVLIGQHQDGRPVVLTGVISDTSQDQDSGELHAVMTWDDTPASPDPFPLVDVVAQPCEADQTTSNVQVYVQGGPPPDWVGVFPLGQTLLQYKLEPASVAQSSTWASEYGCVPTLDGHVLLRWKSGATLICTFSQGGGPATHVASQGSPITAGSAEGNVMIFFQDDQSRRYGNVRMVTTLLYDHPNPAPSQAEPRSYLFSVSSNEPLPINLTPTLIMYFDSATIHDRGDLRVYRLDDADQWQPMPTYIPRGSSFAAMPMNRDTAPNLVKRDGPRIEHYRLFWTPENCAQETTEQTSQGT